MNNFEKKIKHTWADLNIWFIMKFVLPYGRTFVILDLVFNPKNWVNGETTQNVYLMFRGYNKIENPRLQPLVAVLTTVVERKSMLDGSATNCKQESL
jgi:hypothetical protein